MPHFRRFHGHLCRNILSQSRNRFQLADEGKKIKSLATHKAKEKTCGNFPVDEKVVKSNVFRKFTGRKFMTSG